MFCTSLSLASPCSEEDKKYAEVWNNYYDPQDAFDVGETIKKIIDEKDLAGLFEHVDGELTSGPRKNFIAGKNFSEIFSDEWRKSLLESESPCSPVGWRGFMLDSGSVWYNKDKEKDKWHIFGILGAKKEDLNHKNIPVTLEYEGKVIPPHCLSTPWMSGDNYEDFADKFKIKNYDHFSKNPGLYFDNEISDYEPIMASWGSEIYLATSLNKCFKGELRFGGIENIGSPEIKIENKEVETEICETENICQKFSYSILAKLSLDKCLSLSTHVKGNCTKAYLVSIGDYSGGTMGWDMSYNIYGYFSLSNEQKYILPLKNFYKKNDAINYIK
jgi:hypothetical protein